MADREIKIHVPVLARVEGEGALDLEVRDGRIESLQLRIYEPPRLFEKFLEGRSYTEVPDAVARICGICPVAYQMSAVRAIEQAFGVEVDPWIEAMRRALYCGEWIQSHALHIHLLAAPDFLGFDSVVSMAAQHPEFVRRGLRLQDLGNRIIALFGGRSVHPVGVRVGGFHSAPSEHAAHGLGQELAAALDDAMDLLKWSAALPLPDQSGAFVSVAMQHESEYPLQRGQLVADSGLRIEAQDYPRYFREFQVPHSTALHSKFHPHGVEQGDGTDYLVGPLARLNHNFDQLPQPVKRVLHDCGIPVPSMNVFHSIVARAAEIYLALDTASRLLGGYAMPSQPYADVVPRAAEGAGFTEAPRGTLWHYYRFDDQGLVQSARIVPPTSQNQARIEHDLRRALEDFGLQRSDDELRHHAETVIRNYDPCISCATHFLRLRVRRP